MRPTAIVFRDQPISPTGLISQITLAVVPVGSLTLRRRIWLGVITGLSRLNYARWGRMILVINIEDLERELRKHVARVFPPAGEWLKRVAKEKLLTLNAGERDENFLVYEQPPELERDPSLPNASELVMKWEMVVALLRGV